MLTSLVVAREWERGTLELLMASPALRSEIVISKTLSYFALGLVGLCLCLLANRLVFGVPIRGSASLILIGSALYLWVSLAIGLYLSALTRNQYLASQLALILSFLPTVMLSGFIFDLKCAPEAAYYVSWLFPATWYLDMLQTLFLVGNVGFLIARDLAILLLFGLGFMIMGWKKITKSLD
jgi:ABC-2 type transport system permease protein